MSVCDFGKTTPILDKCHNSRHCTIHQQQFRLQTELKEINTMLCCRIEKIHNLGILRNTSQKWRLEPKKTYQQCWPGSFANL